MGERNYPKYDLFRIGCLRRLVKERPFQFLFQLPFVLIFLIIIYAGLFGNQYVSKNIATIATWLIWWSGLIFVIIFFGKVWCLVCPWNAISQWIRRLTFWKKKEDLFTLDKKWPKKLKNIYPATVFFVLLTWLELGYGVTYSPKNTAYLAILLLTMTLVSAVIFERAAFCRYACLVGRVSGLYSLFSSLELRRRDKEICSKICHPSPSADGIVRDQKMRDCALGNELGYPCPTFEYPRVMDLNTYCILCTECVKSCKYDNISLNIRPFATDLIKSKSPKKDEAYLALIMLSMTFFHGVTMLEGWSGLTTQIGISTGLGNLGSFSLAMVAIITLPILVYYIFAVISKATSGDTRVPLKTVFISYAYPFLPIALLFHLAHNSMHLFSEGQGLIPILSDPMGRGWNLFGTATWTLKPILSMGTIMNMQMLLMAVGFIYAVYIGHSISLRTFSDRRHSLKSLFPMLILMILASIAGIWLLMQPMEMRTLM
ncbi:MAG: 4Fe-4S binding protein [Candidatus Hydrothermarchaeaceae archaeon]